jgi:hypothetical protein
MEKGFDKRSTTLGIADRILGSAIAKANDLAVSVAVGV